MSAGDQQTLSQLLDQHQVGTGVFLVRQTPSVDALFPGPAPELNLFSIPPTPAVAPEPSTWAMMLLGFAGLGFAFRQSRRKAPFA
jgi:hypothetical protein